MKEFALLKWLNKGFILKDIIYDPGRNNFNLIRLLAALVVIYIHCIHFSADIYLTVLGAFGVPAFFFLSGLLVSASFYKSSSWKGFVWKRVLRIYPAAIFVILFCALIVGPIITTLSLRSYFSDIDFYKNVSSIFLIHLYTSLPGVFKNESVNASLWTLTLELKMYFFILVWGTLKFSFKNFFLILAALLLIYPGHMFSAQIQWVIRERFDKHFVLHPYISVVPMFLLGMLCYNYKNRIVVRNYWLFIALIVFLIALEVNLLQRIIHILLAIVVLHMGGFNSEWAKKITPRGDYSYGLYVFAFPVEQVVRNYIIPGGNEYLLFFLTLLITFPLAFFSWHLIEKKALRYKGLVN